jgi:hypothetical protein
MADRNQAIKDIDDVSQEQRLTAYALEQSERARDGASLFKVA